jgi:hypothetical protein
VPNFRSFVLSRTPFQSPLHSNSRKARQHKATMADEEVTVDVTRIDISPNPAPLGAELSLEVRERQRDRERRAPTTAWRALPRSQDETRGGCVPAPRSADCWRRTRSRERSDGPLIIQKRFSEASETRCQGVMVMAVCHHG